MTIQQSTDTIVQSATPQIPVGAPTFKSHHPETLALHGGNFRFDPTTGAVAVPIYQTTSYQLPGTEGADKLFALEAPGHLYSRVSNPTQDAFEQRLAEIEGGVAALAVFFRPGRVGLCHPQPRPGRRQHRQCGRPLRRDLGTVCGNAQELRHRNALRRRDRSGSLRPRH